jgi:hypothetical protein
MLVNPAVNNSAFGALRSSSGVQREADGVADQQRRDEDVPEEVQSTSGTTGEVGDARSRVVGSAEETQDTGLGRIRDGEEVSTAVAEQRARRDESANGEVGERGARVDVFI